jgi:flagellar protein FliS
MTLTSPSGETSASVIRARSRYASDGTGGMTSGRTVVQLYQRLERDIDDAERHLAAREIEGAHLALMHAQEIVSALDLALDHRAWDGADDLSRLYRFVRERLIAANVAKDAAPLAACRTVIAPLSAAWRESWSTLAEAK